MIAVDELITRVYETYAQVRAQDRYRVTFHMHPDTIERLTWLQWEAQRDAMTRSIEALGSLAAVIDPALLEIPPVPVVDGRPCTLFGRPLIGDPAVLQGAIEVTTE